MSLIEMRGIERVYGEGEAMVRALAGVDLDIDAGSFCALQGPSGSGKSTLLNVVGCLDRPTAGTYRLRHIETTTLDKSARTRLRRQWIGFVFQGFHLLDRSTALENVELPLLYRGVPSAERRQRALQALDQVGLADRHGHLPKQLSGGQQQRVAIARALVTSPDVLLADEPTGNLDTPRSHEILQLLASLHAKGQTILMVTHEAEMADYASRHIHFRDGRIERDEQR